MPDRGLAYLVLHLFLLPAQFPRDLRQFLHLTRQLQRIKNGHVLSSQCNQIKHNTLANTRVYENTWFSSINNSYTKPWIDVESLIRILEHKRCFGRKLRSIRPMIRSGKLFDIQTICHFNFDYVNDPTLG